MSGGYEELQVTPGFLQDLIAQGETLDVEFKSEHLRSLSDAELVEAVVCLANRSGEHSGWLLVGVEDDGTVTGARPRHHDRTAPERVQGLVMNRTRPSVSVRVDVVSIG